MYMDKKSIIITLFVLAVLFMASPTQAKFIQYDDIPSGMYLGDKAEFGMEFLPESGRTELDGMEMVIAGPSGTQFACRFTPSGKLEDDSPEGCKAIKFRERVQNEYGYGYGYGGDHRYRYAYDVVLETNRGLFKEFGPGPYSVSMTAYAGDESYESGVHTITLAEKPENNGNGQKKK